MAGPRFTDWQRAAAGKVGPVALECDGGRVFFAQSTNDWDDSPSVLSSALLDEPGRAAEVARFEHRVVGILPLPPAAGGVLVTESIRISPKPTVSDVGQRLWQVDTRTGAKEELHGPWGEAAWYLVVPAAPPDGRFVAVSKRLPRLGGKGGETILFLFDLRTRKSISLSIKDQPLTFASWKSAGPDLRALVYTGRVWDKDQSARRAYLADPLTGHMETDPTPLAELDTAALRSPDGRLKADIRAEQQLVVTDVASDSARIFTFHRADRAYLEDCDIWWANSRYLVFSFSRPALVDTETLKMNFPTPREEKIWPVAFTADFTRVIGRSENGLYVGRVVMP